MNISKNMDLQGLLRLRTPDGSRILQKHPQHSHEETARERDDGLLQKAMVNARHHKQGGRTQPGQQVPVWRDDCLP